MSTNSYVVSGAQIMFHQSVHPSVSRMIDCVFKQLSTANPGGMKCMMVWYATRVIFKLDLLTAQIIKEGITLKIIYR